MAPVHFTKHSAQAGWLIGDTANTKACLASLKLASDKAAPLEAGQGTSASPWNSASALVLLSRGRLERLLRLTGGSAVCVDTMQSCSQTERFYNHLLEVAHRLYTGGSWTCEGKAIF